MELMSNKAQERQKLLDKCKCSVNILEMKKVSTASSHP